MRSAQTVIETDHLQIRLGAQNVFWEESGAYTGEIAPGCSRRSLSRYVIVGHSERREIFGETNEDINRKVKAVLAAGMTPILCCGETEDEREAGVTEDKVGSQVRAGLAGLTSEQIAGMVVAYEPIWAIGTGRTASDDDAGAMATFVRATIADIAGDAAESTRILYGGSMNPGNVAGLMAKKDIDGGLVGGASLDPDTFASVIRYWV